MLQELIDQLTDAVSAAATKSSGSESSSSSSSSRGGRTELATKFQAVRQACERVLLVLVQKIGAGGRALEGAAHSVLPHAEVLKLTRRLTGIALRTIWGEPVGFEREVVRVYFESPELWFFRKKVLESFSKALTESPFDSHAAFSFLRVPQCALHGVHVDCPEEQVKLGEAAVVVADKMLLDVGAQVLILNPSPFLSFR